MLNFNGGAVGLSIWNLIFHLMVKSSSSLDFGTKNSTPKAPFNDARTEEFSESMRLVTPSVTIHAYPLFIIPTSFAFMKKGEAKELSQGFTPFS